MKYQEIQGQLDRAKNDKEKTKLLERLIPKLTGPEQRTALLILANLYSLQKQNSKANKIYEIIGIRKKF